MNDYKQLKGEIVAWIQKYFEENASPDTKAVVGISGGKDSSIVAALCTEALGENRVLGVLMPNGEQKDIGVSVDLCNTLGIDYTTIHISGLTTTLYHELDTVGMRINDVVTFNTPARMRMAVLYAVSASVGGRVANTSNASESFVGYDTKGGDNLGDFSPLGNLVVAEVKGVGYETGIAHRFIDKTPDDGMCGKTDEERFGFTYAVLDKYIRTGICEDVIIKSKIDELHARGRHKLWPMPVFVRQDEDNFVGNWETCPKCYKDSYHKLGIGYKCFNCGFMEIPGRNSDSTKKEPVLN